MSPDASFANVPATDWNDCCSLFIQVLLARMRSAQETHCTFCNLSKMLVDNVAPLRHLLLNLQVAPPACAPLVR
jgi:hypothetical protein